MAIIGVHTLTYGVSDVDECVRYFDDFGLPLIEKTDQYGFFQLIEGTKVYIRHQDDKSLPKHKIVGNGVYEVIWGVDTAESLEQQGMSTDLIRRVNGEKEHSLN